MLLVILFTAIRLHHAGCDWYHMVGQVAPCTGLLAAGADGREALQVGEVEEAATTFCGLGSPIAEVPLRLL
jgi:hypothetical protein